MIYPSEFRGSDNDICIALVEDSSFNTDIFLRMSYSFLGSVITALPKQIIRSNTVYSPSAKLVDIDIKSEI